MVPVQQGPIFSNVTITKPNLSPNRRHNTYLIKFGLYLYTCISVRLITASNPCRTTQNCIGPHQTSSDWACTSNVTRKFSFGRLKPMVSTGAQVYNGGLGAEPPVGSRAEPMVMIM